MGILIIVTMIVAAFSWHPAQAAPASPPTPFLYLPFNGTWHSITSWFDHHFPEYTKHLKPITPQEKTCVASYISDGQLEAIAIAPPLVFPRYQQGNPGDSDTRRCYNGNCYVLGYACPGCDLDNEYIWYDGHPGYDFSMLEGTDIYAAGDGIIEYAGCNYKGGEGCSIKIHHDSPNDGYYSYYYHLRDYSTNPNIPWPGRNIPGIGDIAIVGEHVSAGQVIAHSGHTGWKSDGTSAGWGNHLHFEVRYNNHPVDPWGWTALTRDPGEPDNDVLQCYQGEKSYNLFVDYEPHCFGCALPLSNLTYKPLIESVLPPTDYLGGSMDEDTVAPPSADAAQYIVDLTLPDGSIVSPEQSLTKTWRLQNTGTTTWGAGYNLVFVSGEQMGAPLDTGISSTSPNQTVDISVPFMAPTSEGAHSAYFHLRNSQGTYFGPRIWVKINVMTSGAPGGNITVFDLGPESPSSATQVHLLGRAKWFPEFRSMRFMIGDQIIEMPNFRVVGDEVEISTDWSTASLERGTYSIALEVAKNGDNSWSSPERQVKIYTLIGTPIPFNRAPDRPILSSPYNWYLKDTGGSAATVDLCVQPASDPDGNAVSYWFEINNGAVTSGWVGNCWTYSFEPGTYQWRVKSGDGSAFSDWSVDTWNFTVAKGGVYIGSMSLYSANSDNTHICVPITYDGILAPEVYAWINLAADGSENGGWKLLDHYGPNTSPDCTLSNMHGWWIRSQDYTTGNHVIRVNAVKRDSGANQTSTYNYDVAFMRPPAPVQISPSTYTNNGTAWNTPTILFEWQASLRASSYTLRVSTNPNPWDDAAPVLNQTVDADTTSYTHTFGQDYDHLYWSVKANNSAGDADSGNGIWFIIDRGQPTCVVQPLPVITYENVFQVTWSGIDLGSGIRTYDIQYRDSDRNEWADWLTLSPGDKTYELFNGQPGHTYQFRCRATDKAGNTGNYPFTADTIINIDPAARPAEPWWNPSFGSKRSLTVLNNMSGLTLPAGYPVHIQFNSGTIPSAENLYTDSLTATKCDDIRIVYSNTTELDRLILTCTPSLIDLWFKTQIPVEPRNSDNSSYQLYSGNSLAGTPPSDQRNVLSPENDSNTVGLWYFSEGIGSTTADISGNNNNGSIGSLFWVSDKFGNALAHSDPNSGPPGVYIPGNASLTSSAFTFEAYLKRDNFSYGFIASQGQAGSARERWLLKLEDGKLKLTIYPWAGAGASDVKTDSNFLPDSNWHHMAVTFDGNRTINMYRDGLLVKSGMLTNSGINNTNYDLFLGSSFMPSAERFYGKIDQVRYSNIVRTSFPHAAIAAVTNEPSLAAGVLILPPIDGNADLAILSLNAYPNASGGVLIEAVVKNQGAVSTINGFYTDLYMNHLPTGVGDYEGSISFWVNDPIPAGGSVTLTTVFNDLGQTGLTSLAPREEFTRILYSQTDSTGVLNDPERQGNISAGLDVCMAAPDAFENGDGDFTGANWIASSQEHNFDRLSDDDWVKFEAVAGKEYWISTSTLDNYADTYLYLYAADGTTLLAANDDYSTSLASRIVWTAPDNGIYYMKAQQWNPHRAGCGTSYTLSITSQFIYLPAIMR